MSNTEKKIALGPRLRHCRNVITLGVKPNIEDYGKKNIALIQNASKIYYPSTLYADLFDAMGKQTFPSYHTYKCSQDKIKQTALFTLLNIPHPRTRVFYGNRQKKNILDYFSFPFVAKIPRGSSMGRGVFLINSHEDLIKYCGSTHVAYIQEFLETDRDIRVVIIGEKVAHAYWRHAAPGEFRSNVASGGAIRLDPVSDQVLNLALHSARACCWDDVGIDIIIHNGTHYVLEANVRYGKEGFRKAGIDYINMMEEKIENGDI